MVLSVIFKKKFPNCGAFDRNCGVFWEKNSGRVLALFGPEKGAFWFKTFSHFDQSISKSKGNESVFDINIKIEARNEASFILWREIVIIQESWQKTRAENGKDLHFVLTCIKRWQDEVLLFVFSYIVSIWLMKWVIQWNISILYKRRADYLKYSYHL